MQYFSVMGEALIGEVELVKKCHVSNCTMVKTDFRRKVCLDLTYLAFVSRKKSQTLPGGSV